MQTLRLNLFSVSLVGVLLLSLAGSYLGIGIWANTSNPRNEPAINRESELDIGVCDPEAGPFSTKIDHPYFSYSPGDAWVFKGSEDGAELRLRITVLDETEVVAGVKTRVVEEREWEDGDLIEVSRNFFVQAQDGTVCYYGEEVDIYENGEVVSHEGAWRAGEDDNRPGIIMPAEPAEDMTYAQEVAPGVAEDRAEIISLGEDTVTVPAGTYDNTLQTRETTPLEPGAESFKVYARGVGLIVDDVVELVRITTAGDDDDGEDDEGSQDDDEDGGGDDDEDDRDD